MTKIRLSLAILLVTSGTVHAKGKDGVDDLLGSLWQDSLFLSEPESLLVHQKVGKWLNDSLANGKAAKTEIYAQKYSEVWQVGEGVDSVQAGIKLMRFELDPEIFSKVKPEIAIHRCNSMACGPSIGYLLLNGKKAIGLPCGYSGTRSEVSLVLPIENKICAAITYKFGGKTFILSTRELELNEENRKFHLKNLPFISGR